MLKEVIQNVIETGQTSATYIQKKFNLSFEESKIIINKMEEMKIISNIQDGKPRQVLVNQEQWEELKKKL